MAFVLRGAPALAAVAHGWVTAMAPLPASSDLSLEECVSARAF